MDQIFQIAGAIMILVAFAGIQRGTLSASSRLYLWLNLVGSLVLTGVALHGRDWGFLLLEIVWALVSLWSLVQLARGREPGAAH